MLVIPPRHGPRRQRAAAILSRAPEADRAVLGAELAELPYRAVGCGSVDAVISARELRAAIVAALRQG